MIIGEFGKFISYPHCFFIYAHCVRIRMDNALQLILKGSDPKKVICITFLGSLQSDTAYLKD